MNQLVFGQILNGLGLSYRIAGNGRTAVEMYRALQPKLILMDVSMPEMNGYEATRAIRAVEARSGVAYPDHRRHRPCAQGRPREMHRSRHGRLSAEADLAGPARRQDRHLAQRECAGQDGVSSDKTGTSSRPGRRPTSVPGQSGRRNMYRPPSGTSVKVQRTMPCAVEQELADKLTVTGRHHLLVGLGHFVAVLLVEEFTCRESDSCGSRQLARHVDLHGISCRHRDLVWPGRFVLGEFEIGQARTPDARFAPGRRRQAASASGDSGNRAAHVRSAC